MKDWVEWTKKNKRIVIGIGIFLIIGIPFLIHMCFIVSAPVFWMEATWNSGDLLGFYGCILTGIITILGVFCTVQYSQKQYKEDVENRVKPYLVAELKDKKFLTKDFIDRTDFKVIYIGISDRKVQLKNKIDMKTYIDNLADIVESKLDNGKTKHSFRSSNYLVLSLLSCGNGTAINCKVFCSLKNERPEYESIPSVLPVGERLFIVVDLNKLVPKDAGEYSICYAYDDVCDEICEKYNGKMRLVINQDLSGSIELA